MFLNRKRKTREARKQITFWAVCVVERAGGYATMTAVARHMGLKPSTYVMDLLRELWDDGMLIAGERELAYGRVTRIFHTNPDYRVVD